MKKTILTLLTIFTLFSCQIDKNINPLEPQSFEDLVVSEGFDWATSEIYTFNYRGKDFGNSVTRPLTLSTPEGDTLKRISSNLSEDFSLKIRIPDGNPYVIASWGTLTDTISLQNQNVINFNYYGVTNKNISIVSNDFEIGNRNAYISQCWRFISTNVNGGNNALAGQFSMRTGQMSNLSNPHTLITPWIDINPGNLTFRTGLTSLNGGGKYLDVILIDENQNETTLLNHTFIMKDAEVFNIPLNINGIHRIAFKYYGDGGNSRGLLDELFIPGTYASDPGNFCLPISQPLDSDGDGVSDEDDDFPNDPNKAFNNYTPSPSSFNTLVFEDLWPSQGNYDFNDLVVNYRFNEITNSNNEVVEIQSKLFVRAVGGSQDNGFAIQLDNLTPSDIASVNGQEITGNLFSISSNGTELGQTKAVIPVYNTPDNVTNPVGGSFYNTIPSNGVGVSDIIDLTIVLSNPISDIGNAPYNPFIIKDQMRGVEIHLVDKQPTDLADMSLLGTNSDDSNVGNGKYYKTSNNLPWALDLDCVWEYPIENADIIETYLKFQEWAESDGILFPDWHINPSPGYRNLNNIF